MRVVRIVEMNNGCIIILIFKLVKVRLKMNILNMVWICVKGILCNVVIMRVLLMIVVIDEIVFIVVLVKYKVSGILGLR